MIRNKLLLSLIFTSGVLSLTSCGMGSNESGTTTSAATHPMELNGSVSNDNRVVHLISAIDKNKNFFSCTGVWVSENKILTAGHCAADHMRYLIDNLGDHQIYSLETEITFADFANGDIAGYTISTYPTSHGYAKLATQLPQHDDIVTSIGFGVTDKTASDPDGSASLPPLLNKLTFNADEQAFISLNPTKTGSTYHNACHGDSGGPIFDQSNNLIGLDSHGIPRDNLACDYENTQYISNLLAPSVNSEILAWINS